MGVSFSVSLRRWRPETLGLAPIGSLRDASDRALAAGAALLLAPLCLLLATAAYLRTGRCFDSDVSVGRCGVPFRRLRFAGTGRIGGLAVLCNLVRGDLAWIGPRPLEPDEIDGLETADLVRFDARPGLMSLYEVRAATGIDFDGEATATRSHVLAPEPAHPLGVLARGATARILGGSGPGSVVQRTLDVLGVRIDNLRMDEAVGEITDAAARREPLVVSFANADCLNIAARDPGYRAVLGLSDRVLPDGIGVRLAGRMLRTPLAGNVNGTDLFPRLCEEAARRGLGIFLLGARPGVAQDVQRVMSERFPGLRIVGCQHGYLDPQEWDEVVREVASSGADILLVALGAPLQERWIDENLDACGVPVALGVGGLLDFYSGRIQRAPSWLREIGMEWAWRMLQEPSRMWRRYVLGNPLFLYRVARQAFPLEVGAWVRLRSWADVVQERCRDGSKRLIDIAGASIGIVLLAPAGLLVAAAIRAESRGAVLFRQTRVGAHGTHFELLKFRSMVIDAERSRPSLEGRGQMSGGVRFKMKRDPRITRVGRWMRRLSIDELPQLWNVLRGDMSLVGPRPALPSETAIYGPDERERLAVKPGITCFWQTEGRSEIPFDKQVEMDVAYVDRGSTLEDVKILLRTIPAVISGKGAY